jgi:hypothetical protein
MDLCPTPEAVALDELFTVQAILAGVTAALDEVERYLPAMVCTWRGTARDAYGANLTYLNSQFAVMVSSIRDAQAAIASAISVAS